LAGLISIAIGIVWAFQWAIVRISLPGSNDLAVNYVPTIIPMHLPGGGNSRDLPYLNMTTGVAISNINYNQDVDVIIYVRQ